MLGKPQREVTNHYDNGPKTLGWGPWGRARETVCPFRWSGSGLSVPIDLVLFSQLTSLDPGLVGDP